MLRLIRGLLTVIVVLVLVIAAIAGGGFVFLTRRAFPQSDGTAQVSGVKTMILVNRERVAAQYNEAAATQLMNKLSALAAHPQVSGEVIRLDGAIRMGQK